MGVASRKAWEIIKQKQMYWSKVLSEDSLWATLGQTFNVLDWASFFGDWVLSDTLWSSLVSSLLLDIPMIDIVPINIIWDIELPTTEEFLRGVLIKLSKIDISYLLPEFKLAFETPSLFLEPEYQVNIEETKLQKGFYGISKYGQSYYDPTAVREFFRSALYSFLKKKDTLETAKLKVEQTANLLDIHPELARTLFNRLSAIYSVKEKALTWDYGWWDRTIWGEEGSEGKITFVTYELETVKMPYEDLIDYQAGGFWDDACWDYFYWTEDHPSLIHPYRLDKYNVAEVQDRIWGNWRSRLVSTYLAVANYQRLEERRKWTRSERVDMYASGRMKSVFLERAVENIVKTVEPNIDAHKLRLFKSAVLQLYGELTGTHRWGNEMHHAMSEEELKSWWLGTWEGMGLTRSTLETLYDRLKDLIRNMSARRQKERLRFLRKRLFRR